MHERSRCDNLDRYTSKTKEVKETTIQISPEYGIILDEDYKLVGEAREDVAIIDIGPLEEKVEEVELLAEELLSSLNPDTAPLIASKKRREGIYKTAGILGNTVLGFTIGCLIFTLLMLLYVMSQSPELLKSIFGG
jgi:tetrahydromethanopterin S-methyltransferase subunit B